MPLPTDEKRLALAKEVVQAFDDLHGAVGEVLEVGALGPDEPVGHVRLHAPQRPGGDFERGNSLEKGAAQET